MTSDCLHTCRSVGPRCHSSRQKAIDNRSLPFGDNGSAEAAYNLEELSFTKNPARSNSIDAKTKKEMESMPVTNKAAGEPLTTKSEVLETGAALTQVCA